MIKIQVNYVSIGYGVITELTRGWWWWFSDVQDKEEVIACIDGSERLIRWGELDDWVSWWWMIAVLWHRCRTHPTNAASKDRKANVAATATSEARKASRANPGWQLDDGLLATDQDCGARDYWRQSSAPHRALATGQSKWVQELARPQVNSSRCWCSNRQAAREDNGGKFLWKRRQSGCSINPTCVWVSGVRTMSGIVARNPMRPDGELARWGFDADSSCWSRVLGFWAFRQRLAHESPAMVGESRGEGLAWSWHCDLIPHQHIHLSRTLSVPLRIETILLCNSSRKLHNHCAFVHMIFTCMPFLGMQSRFWGVATILPIAFSENEKLNTEEYSVC